MYFNYCLRSDVKNIVTIWNLDECNVMSYLSWALTVLQVHENAYLSDFHHCFSLPSNSSGQLQCCDKHAFTWTRFTRNACRIRPWLLTCNELEFLLILVNLLTTRTCLCWCFFSALLPLNFFQFKLKSLKNSAENLPSCVLSARCFANEVFVHGCVTL